jgi:hypothetical protein
MGLPEALVNVIKKMYHDVHIKADVNGIVFTFSRQIGPNLVPLCYPNSPLIHGQELACEKASSTMVRENKL